ncbi:MAG: hypothetical protein AAFQ64_08770 [Pseudomonadota bacterium]
MSLTVAATEHGMIRVFRLSEPLFHALETAPDLAPLEKSLGVIIAKSTDVQLIAADSLKGLGLAPFLAMGYGIDSDAIADAVGLQDASEDNFVVIRSGAFGGAEVALADAPDAALIATLKEEGPAAAKITPLQSDGAAGTLSQHEIKQKPKSDARIGGMVATIALLVLFGLVGLMIWIAG